MKRYLLTREEFDHTIVEADNILDAYMHAYAEQEHDEDDTSEIEIYELGDKYVVKENKCKDPFVFTKVKK